MSAVFIQAAEVCLITQTVGEIVPKRNFKGHSCMQVGDISSLAIRIKTLMYRNCPSEQALPNGVRSWKVCLSSFVVFFSLGLLSLLFAAFQNWKVSGISGILHQNLQFGLFLRHTYSILELKCGLYTILFTACFSWKLDTHLYSAMCDVLYRLKCPANIRSRSLWLSFHPMTHSENSGSGSCPPTVHMFLTTHFCA